MKVKLNASAQLALEVLIDAHGLSKVLEALATICHGKAEHLESNWQDAITAKAWTRAAGMLETVSCREAARILSD